MLVPEHKKHEYWNHFVARWAIGKTGHVPGITKVRLRNVKSILWNDNEFWSDIVYRHSGDKMTPEQMMKSDEATYEHCSGNFWGMIVQEMIERGWIQ